MIPTKSSICPKIQRWQAYSSKSKKLNSIYLLWHAKCLNPSILHVFSRQQPAGSWRLFTKICRAVAVDLHPRVYDIPTPLCPARIDYFLTRAFRMVFLASGTGAIPNNSASIFFPSSAKITALSTAFSNSLTFPGQP